MGKVIFLSIIILSVFSCSKKDSSTISPTPPQTVNDQKILFNSGDSTFFYDITNKKLIWKKFFKPTTHLYVDSTKIFITAASYIYTFGFNPSQASLWSFYTGALGYTPAPSIVYPVGNDSLVFVTGDYSASVFAIYKNSGTLKWKTDLKLPPAFGPTRTVDPVLVNDKIIVSGQNKVFCLNALNGNILWSYTTDNVADESLTDCVSNGKIYHLQVSGMVHCIDMNGSFIWKKKISTTFALYDKDNITVKNGVLYLFAELGQSAVDAASGNILWQKPYKSLLGSYDICYSKEKIYSSYGRILVEAAASGDSIAAITPVPFRILSGQTYEKSFSFLSATSDKLISELIISGSIGVKDTLFFFNTKDLSVYDKITLPGKGMTFPPIIFENGRIIHHIQSGNEN